MVAPIRHSPKNLKWEQDIFSSDVSLSWEAPDPSWNSDAATLSGYVLTLVTCNPVNGCRPQIKTLDATTTTSHGASYHSLSSVVITAIYGVFESA